jgi:hypothetical protein
MHRFCLFLLAALTLVALGCLRTALEPAQVSDADVRVAVAPLPTPPSPTVWVGRTGTPVAPMPHEPGELDSELDLCDDPGLDAELEAALPESDRIDRAPVEAADPPEPVPAPPNVDPPGGAKVPGAADDPPGKGPQGPFAWRSESARTRRIKDIGGTAESEAAVARGLAWLARQQKQDGGWEFDQGSKEERAAATGLVLQALLAAGETHKPARDKEEVRKHTKVVSAGLAFLMKLCPVKGMNPGRMSANIYAQAIATTALVEAYAMTKDPGLKPYAQAALGHLQKVQAANGSWGYTPNTNGDVSITGWVVQALSSAKAGGLSVDDKVLKGAVQFLDFAAGGKEKSMYGYTNNAGAAPGTALTASGLWARASIGGWGPDHPGMIDGLAGLMKNPPAGSGGVRNLYYYQYATQVVRFCGGADWVTWNEGRKQADGTRTGGMRDWLVAQQAKKGDAAKIGSWDPEAGWFGAQCGRLGTTAVCVLQLEVYYRYVPAEKLADKGDKPDDPKK